MILVSEAFDGVPWLERVHQAASLWDADEMGAPAEVHCYTAGGVRAQARGPAGRALGRPSAACRYGRLGRTVTFAPYALSQDTEHR